MIPHALAEVASPEMVEIWMPRRRIELERSLWIHVMEAQETLTGGRLVTQYDIDAYVAVEGAIDWERIEEIERRTKHDIKAHLEAFNEMAGRERAHLGMTSADVIDNVYQIRIRDSAVLLADLLDLGPLNGAVRSYPFRGIKGAVGTQQDMVDLLGAEKAGELDRFVADQYGFLHLLTSVGQVYPRSIDLDIATQAFGGVALVCPSGPLLRVAAGYLGMLAEISHGQWNEGDVSGSVVRRVAWPGLFLALDAALVLT